jgi:hypothetical protein
LIFSCIPDYVPALMQPLNCFAHCAIGGCIVECDGLQLCYVV